MRLFRELELESNLRHMHRLRQGPAKSIESSPVHLDVIRDLTQINTLRSSTAYAVLEVSGELLRSRLRRDSHVQATSERADGC